jgi:hypothetical protein
MENRIKEQMCLFAYRLSTEEMKGNQLRLYLSALAYTLVEALRRLALKGTEWAEAQVDTIRLKLFKIGALVPSAPGACGWNSVPPIRGSRFTPGPSTRCDAESQRPPKQTFPLPPRKGSGGAMPQIQPRH